MSRRVPDVELGYWLSSEEHGAGALAALAERAEAVGFRSAMVSDHLQPWTDQQGHAPFVWTVLGAISQRTSALRLATGVTAAICRMHPLVVAHAAATVATLLPGRFALGLGTGERLNEQPVGQRWPRPGDRRRMMAEGLGIIRGLLAGEEVNVDGDWFRVEHGLLHGLPPVPPEIYVAAGGWRSAELAGRDADGMIAVAPEPELVQAFESAGGAGKRRIGQLHVCWAEDEAEARRTAWQWWPQIALPGAMATELPRTKDFQRAAALVTEDAVAAAVVCGPDVDRFVEGIARFAAAGFTEVHLHQIGPDQAGFFSFAERELLPRFR